MSIRILRYLTVIALAVLLLAVPARLVTAGPSSNLVDVLIKFKQSPGPDEQALVSAEGGLVKRTYHIVPAVAASVPQDRLNALSSNPRVSLVEEDITVHALSQSLPWGVDRIDAELVHPTNKGAGVKVAILDSGIDLDHPDLNVAGDVTFIPGTPSGDDDNGHGTLVAGIVAALDNAIGVIGVAPEASLYSVKVLNQNGEGVMSVILSGIEWSVDNNMQVINMSLGSAMNWPTTVIEALDNAYSAGIVIVAGAGNGGTPDGQGENIWAPARYDSVIAVGATDELDNRYSSSSTGSTLELMAPGVNIPSTAMGGGYDAISETSASSPHAAGAAALLIAAGMSSNVNIRQTLRDSAQDLGDPGWDAQYGWGLINAKQAVDLVEPPIVLTSSQDSFLRKGHKNTNEGANPSLVVQRSGPKRTVVAFDLSGVTTSGLAQATLALTIAESTTSWGSQGRLVNVHRLTELWTEGNGSNWQQTPGFRGNGPGVTWNCATDADISNSNPDSGSLWDGGWLAAEPATAPGVLHTNGMTGEVTWDVTTDVLAALNESATEVSWLIKKESEGQNGKVVYYSKEGAADAGDPNLGPRLTLGY